VQSWNALTFNHLTVGIRDLDRCLGVSRRGGSRPLTLEIDDFALSLFDAETRTEQFKVSSVKRYALATVRATSRRHLSEFLSGPVKTLRMLCEFATGRQAPLTRLEGAVSRKCLGTDCEIIMPWGNERDDGEMGREQYLSFRGLGRQRFRRLATNWHTARADLWPLLDLFSSLTTDRSLAAELRFLTLVDILEAFHRMTRRQPAPKKALTREIERLVASTNDTIRDRVKGVLGLLQSPSLQMRLEELFAQAPDGVAIPLGSFMHRLSGGRDFSHEVVQTRNFLTHLRSERSGAVLNGFPLLNACFRLELMFRFLLLRYFGFSRTNAHGAILAGRYGSTPGFSTILDA
jgi:hypothetical protein